MTDVAISPFHQLSDLDYSNLVNDDIHRFPLDVISNMSSTVTNDDVNIFITSSSDLTHP